MKSEKQILHDTIGNIYGMLQDQYTCSDGEMCEKIVKVINKSYDNIDVARKQELRARLRTSLEDFIGATVYHVANPNVPGKVTHVVNTERVYVNFSEPVGFSGNPIRGKATSWSCSTNLLFSTSEEAYANHDPERAKMYDPG